MSSVPTDELVEALKELTYEHGVFFGRINELTDLLAADSSRATDECIKFIEKAVFPHCAREEEKVFPVILKLRPEKKPLIEELKEEHEGLLESRRRLSESLAQGKSCESILKESLESLKAHANKEEPLYQLLLKEVIEK